jgi:hypothetical protein
MSSISVEKIERMLKVYRDRLATAETPPIDYAVCMQLSAKIGLLEDLYFMALQDAAQPAAQPAADNVDEFEEVMAQLDPHVAGYIRESRR